LSDPASLHPNQDLFNISATEKAATPVIPPADDNAFNGSLSDETAVMAWLKKRIAVQLRLSDPASLHPNQDLFNISATEKAATPVIPPADDN
ncbi:hypothetical protein CQA09_28590, partial [Klebsiella pneumoniae]